MACRPIITPIIDYYDENNEPVYKTIGAGDNINIMRLKIESRKESNGFVSDAILLKIITRSLLENISVDSIETTDLIITREYLDVSRYTDYDKFLSVFIKNKIGSFLNISFDDFLRKNIIEIDSIIRITDIAIEEMGSHIANELIENNLNKPEGIY